jgi:hypothetical protein
MNITNVSETRKKLKKLETWTVTKIICGLSMAILLCVCEHCVDCSISCSDFYGHSESAATFNSEVHIYELQEMPKIFPNCSDIFSTLTKLILIHTLYLFSRYIRHFKLFVFRVLLSHVDWFDYLLNKPTRRTYKE